MAKLIKNLIYKVIPAEHHWKFILFKQWDLIIGTLKNRVTIEKIDGDTLYLSTTHPAWANEILLLAPLLKQKINTCLTSPKIRNIHLKASPNKAKSSIEMAKPMPSQPTAHQPIQSVLTPQEKTILAHLPDKTLQLVIANYFIRCKDQKRSKDEHCMRKKVLS